MRVALIAGSCHGDPTAFNVLNGLSRGLSARRHAAVILSKDEKRFPGLRLRPAPSDPACAYFKNAPSSLLRGLGIDVAHFMFSGLFRPWHGSLLRAFRSMRLKVVVTFQDYRHPELPQNSPARRRKLGELLVRADRVTAVSRFLLARVLADFPSIRGKSSAVPNGTDVMEARPVRKKPYILSIGRYSPYKGTDLLLWAYAEFLRKGHDADLVLCGPKFREKHFSGLAQRLGIGGRVRMLGLKRPEELLALRRDCLFYAAASRFETFGMAILEAMAAGKAVLATAAGGIPEFVRNGRNGLLAGPEGLADGMARLFKDARLRERLGANGRRAAERFRWGRIAGEYLRLYS